MILRVAYSLRGCSMILCNMEYSLQTYSKILYYMEYVLREYSNIILVYYFKYTAGMFLDIIPCGIFTGENILQLWGYAMWE